MGKNFSNIGRKMLSQVSREVQPKMEGGVFSEIGPNKRNGEMLKEETGFYATWFTSEELTSSA